jgi:integrase/recombinase XerC
MGNADVDAIRALLARLDLSVEQLVDAPTKQRPIPTFREYVSRVADAVPSSTLAVYGTYWRRVEEVWGDRRLDEPTPLEIAQLAEAMKDRVVRRRNGRGGRSAAEHLVGALRCLYRFAVTERIIAEQDNPAARVAKPRRLGTTRRAIPEARLAEINRTAATTGNDPELDTLLLRLHVETACRRGGALGLRRGDLDVEQCLVLLREKGGTVRWQPVSPSLMKRLVAHAEERGSGPDGQVLRYRSGRPITVRRYDYLWSRLGRHLRWVATQQVTTHWLRYTTLTWVERNYGYAVARAYAGHTGKSDAGTTTTYVRVDVEEVAEALSGLTGERHPLVQGGEVGTRDWLCGDAAA